MDKEAFRNYINLLKEIDENDRRINQLQRQINEMKPKAREVTDIVTCGKRGKKPIATKKIHGFYDHSAINKKIANMRRRISIKHLQVAALEERIADVEEYIANMKDDELRRLLTLYCADGDGKLKPWEQVADEMGPGYTAESCRKMFSRAMRKAAEQGF